MTATQDLTPTVMITTRDPIPVATLAGDTAMGAALRDFEGRYPAYAGTAVLDGMRARDYTRLDATGHVYLDYTGGGLYADSQLARHRDLLAGAVFGNPHSQNVPSRGMGTRVEATRAKILQFFRASPGRAPGQPGGNLPAQRLPLQPRRPRGRARILRPADGGRLQRQGPAPLPGLPPRNRREDHRGGTGLDRPGHHLRRRLPVLGIRPRLPRPALPRGRDLSWPPDRTSGPLSAGASRLLLVAGTVGILIARRVVRHNRPVPAAPRSRSRLSRGL
jgi:hypothetical protein